MDIHPGEVDLATAEPPFQSLRAGSAGSAHAVSSQPWPSTVPPAPEAETQKPATASSNSAGRADAAELQPVQRDSGFGQVDVGVDETGGEEGAVKVNDLH